MGRAYSYDAGGSDCKQSLIIFGRRADCPYHQVEIMQRMSLLLPQTKAKLQQAYHRLAWMRIKTP